MARLLESREKRNHNSHTVAQMSALPTRHADDSAFRTPGEALHPQTRAALEPGFGHDFSTVRIHADAEAAAAARSLGATAFTVGSDVFFADGAFETDSPDGMHLLAHELTHVAQSRGRSASSSSVKSRRGDASEAEARAAADNVLAGRPVPSVSAAPAVISMEDSQDKPFWDSGIFKAISTGAGFLPGPAGMAAKILRHPFQIARGAEAAQEGDALKSFQEFGGAASGLGGAAAAAGGFSMFGEAGLLGAASTIGAEGLGVFGTVGGLGAGAGATLPASAALTGGGLSGVAALGPAAAVLGAGVAGVGAGIGLDHASDWIGDKITGNEGGDHSISGGLASGMTAADEAVSGLLADPSKPAYTQTLGWKLAELFD